jgi:transposase
MINNESFLIYFDFDSNEVTRKINKIRKHHVSFLDLKAQYLRSKRNSNQFKIKFIGTKRIIDVLNNENQLKRFKNNLTPYKISKNIDYLKESLNLSLIKNGFVYFNKDLNLKIRIEKEKRKNLRAQQVNVLRFKIAKLYFFFNKSPYEISKDLGILESKVKSLLCNLRYSDNSLGELLLKNKFNSQTILLDNYKEIVNLYQKNGICRLSIKMQLKSLQITNDCFKTINIKQYKRFLKEILRIKFRKFKRMGPDFDSNKIIKVRQIVCHIIIEILRKNYHVLFFDESTLCESSYSNKAWSLNLSTKIPISSLKQISQRSNLLMICSASKIENYWIVDSINKQVTLSFLYESINKYRREQNIKKLIIFWDNARIHHSKEMKKLAKYMRVYFIFNAPYSCKLNMMEYIFELIKRKLRKQFNKEKNKNTHKIFFQEIIKTLNINLSAQRLIMLKEMLKCLFGLPMWFSY